MFKGDDDMSYFRYDNEDAEAALPATFHDMTDVEVRFQSI
jgi:hypothetical protein